MAPRFVRGSERFNDNRRLHLYVVNVQTRQVRQLTSGNFYEHSINWSPDGTQLAFLSNHEPDPDFKNNYDVFLFDVASGAVGQLAHTGSNVRPIWSPDGKAIAVQGLKRQLTSLETNSETRASGRSRQPAGSAAKPAAIDNRQGPPAMGRRRPLNLFTVQSRRSAGLYRMPAEGGRGACCTGR